MTAEIICVGTELLLGNIVNTNAAYLAQQLAALGITCYHQTVVGDNRERLLDALELAAKRSELILLSGGLGPTRDDLTKETVAEFCSKKLVTDEKSKRQIEAYFVARGIKPTQNNWKQAMVPEGCKVLENHNGTAPGVVVVAKKINE